LFFPLIQDTGLDKIPTLIFTHRSGISCHIKINDTRYYTTPEVENISTVEAHVETLDTYINIWVL
jgi:hypothetical protein